MPSSGDVTGSQSMHIPMANALAGGQTAGAGIDGDSTFRYGANYCTSDTRVRNMRWGEDTGSTRRRSVDRYILC